MKREYINERSELIYSLNILYILIGFPRIRFSVLTETATYKNREVIMVKEEYFTKVPNSYIRCDITKTFGVNNKFFIIYILIDRYRSYEDYSWLTVKEVFEFYDYKKPERKTKAFREVIDVLIYMIKNDMIKIFQNLEDISYDTGIKIRIIPKNFDCESNFTKFTTTHYKAIMAADGSINKENLLRTLLYVSSYIGTKKSDNDGGYEKPAAFYKSTANMAEEIGMSKKTIQTCLSYLTKGSKHISHIYVFNCPGYEQEIEQVLKKITNQM